MAAVDDATASYGAFLETLTRESLGALEAYCAPDVRFRDPFNDVVGVSAFRAVLEKMFDDVREPRFVVTHRACAGRVGYLRWDFSFRGRRRPHRIEGVSEIRFNEACRVAAHFDHWDASQVYSLVPVLGAAIRLVRRRLQLRRPARG